MSLGGTLLKTVESARRRAFQEVVKAAYSGGSYWPLTNNAKDVVGSKDMTIVGGVNPNDTLNNGVIFDGLRANLNGSTGYLKRASETWTFGNIFTLRMLFKQTTSGLSTMYLFGGDSGKTFPSIRRGGSDVNRAAIFSSAEVCETGTDYLVPGLEYDLVVVRNGTGAGKTTVYLNGVAMPLATDAAVDFANQATAHYIGARETSGAPSLFLSGSIAHVAWTPSALSQATIQSHVDAWQPVPTRFTKLSWSPPTLTNPTTINVTAGSGQLVTLAAGQDYIIVLPGTPLAGQAGGGLKIDGNGANNVVVIGGEINITTDPGSGYGVATRGVSFFNVQGTVHVEGLYVHGAYCSDGIDMYTETGFTPGNIQIQCCRVDVRTPNQNISLTHPDIIQIACAASVKVDRVSGSSDYQGFSLIPGSGGPATIGPVIWRRTSVVQVATAVSPGKLYWQSDDTVGPVTFDRCYLLPLPGETMANSVWPNSAEASPRNAVQDTTTRTVSWPNDTAHLIGHVTPGIPPGGEFALASTPGRGVPGIGYVTPGYAN